MRGLATTAIMMLAVAGLSACNRNEAANDIATAKSAAPAAAAPAAPAVPAAGAGMDPTAFRTAIAEQCVMAARANPNIPRRIDLAGACACASEATLAGRADPFAFTQTPDGQQVFNRSLMQCLQQQGARAGGPAPGADEERGADDANE